MPDDAQSEEHGRCRLRKLQSGKRVNASLFFLLYMFALHAPPTLADVGETDSPATTRDTAPLDGPSLLEQYGIARTELRAFQVADQAGVEQETALLKLLYAVRRMYTRRQPVLWQIEQKAQGFVSNESVANQPGDLCGQLFRIEGRVVSVETQKLSAETAAQYEMTQYYRCELVLDTSQARVTIYTLAVPRAWSKTEDVNEPASALAFLVREVASPQIALQPEFVTHRIAWQADTAAGQLGMDVGLFDEVQNRQPLLAAEGEAFYSLLSAIASPKAAALDQKLAEDSFDVAPLFNEPDRQHGRLVVLKGRARRAIRIAVEDPLLQQRFGIDEYFEMELVTDDSQRNPLVVCVRKLPTGMPTGGNLNESVAVVGLFFKVWAYRREAPRTDPHAPMEYVTQLAPLLIGRPPVWYPQAAPQRNLWAGAVAGGLFIVAVAGLWIVLWRVERGDRAVQRHLRSGGVPPTGDFASNDDTSRAER